MNILKKIYCRIFQKCFKSAIPILPYSDPVVLTSFQEVTDILNKDKVESVLLITDKNIRQLGISTPLENLIKKNNISLSIYDETQPNPTTEDVEKAKKVYLKNNCTGIIALGGGSHMDCAKGVGVLISKKNKNLNQVKGLLKVHKKLPPIFAIPTTAGTGSEVTATAVIIDAKTRHKYCINDFPLIPKYAVLIPEITLTLPKHLTATTGLDALTHAIEAYIGNSTTKRTRKEAIIATQLIFDNLYIAYSDGDNLKARENMLKASYHAGNAFRVSYVGYVHAISHTLSGKYNTPHGLANAVLLPFVLEEYGESAHKKLYELAIATNIANKNDSYKTGAEKFIEKIRELKIQLNIGDTIPELLENDIPYLAEYADKEANPLYPVPKLMDKKELEKLYYMVLDRSK